MDKELMMIYGRFLMVKQSKYLSKIENLWVSEFKEMTSTFPLQCCRCSMPIRCPSTCVFARHRLSSS